jgi:translation initiation factor 2 beta subunit (eIF-2beta)/eIF-5
VVQNLFLKYLGFDDEPKCPECKSMDYDLTCGGTPEEFVLSCNSCGQNSVIAKKV